MMPIAGSVAMSRSSKGAPTDGGLRRGRLYSRSDDGFPGLFRALRKRAIEVHAKRMAKPAGYGRFLGKQRVPSGPSSVGPEGTLFRDANARLRCQDRWLMWLSRDPRIPVEKSK